MKQSDVKHRWITVLDAISQKINLAIFMLLVGAFTAFASFNTYEVIARRDAPFTNVITNVVLTNSDKLNNSFIDAETTNYTAGSFGVPKKIKLPEAERHIDIVTATYAHDWKASKGLAQYFLTAKPRQKVFGEAVIYLRANTTTTRHLGTVYSGDIVNIVTTEGWQLGYKVTSVANDPKALNKDGKGDTSKIIVILVDEHSGNLKSFNASLVKVGERI